MEHNKQPPPGFPLPSQSHQSYTDAIDAEVFQSFVAAMGGDDDPAWVRDLVETYLDDASRLMREVREAVDQQQPAALQSAAHSLKSSSAQLGAMTLSGLSKELETRGRNGTMEGTPEIVGQLETIYAQVHTELSERLQTL